jgi:adenylate cyclase
VRKSLIGGGIGLLAALLALALGRVPFAEVVELKTYDWRMRATADPEGARDDIVLVTIDEESLRGLEPIVGRWPWPRLVHAQLLNYLARARPRAVLYDVLFTEQDRSRFFVQDQEWTGAESDAELAASARQVPLVLPGDAVPEAREGQPPAVSVPGLSIPPDVAAETRPVLVPPIPGIAAAARVVAHNFAVLDADGPWRRYVPLVGYQGQVIPSLAVGTAAVALGLDGRAIRSDAEGLLIGDRRFPLTTREVELPDGSTRETRRALIRFRGRRADGESPYRRVSFYRLFYSEQQLLEGQAPLEPPDGLRDTIVVVGATAAALDDVFTVPVAGKMAGLEVHASVVDSLLSGRTIARAPAASAVVLTVAAALLLGVVGAQVGPWVATVLALALAAGVTWFTTWQFGSGLWYPLVTPLAALGLAAFGDVAYEYFVEGREKRQVKRLFSRYVSRDVYEQLIKDPAGARLGGHRRTMTVLFSDIRGFTSVSEKGEPEAIVAQLNEYFSRMVPIVFAHRGTVDKFVGDMIMALFGAPLDDPDHADHAVQTALAMSEGLAQLNREWRAAGRPVLDIGIGINTGEMVAGNLGSEAIMSYTVIGDQVNLGSRLESLTKEFHTRLIVSEATVAALKGRYDIEALGDVVVKGKSVPVKIFSVKPPGAAAGGLHPEARPADNPRKAVPPAGSEEQATS